jgi:REP element-mobilizing transposase RayT
VTAAFHQLYIHFIWRTYKNIEFIDAVVERSLWRLVDEKLQEFSSELICYGCTEDHVHILVRMHPRISISKMIGAVKGYTSYVIANEIVPEIGFRWQRGYGAFSISERNLRRLIRYIRNQKEHHERGDLVNCWEA